MTDTTSPVGGEPIPGTPELCLPPHLRKVRYRRTEASDYLRLAHGIEVAAATLAKWASIGGGPAYQKVNRTPLYPRTELDAWAAEKLGDPIRTTTAAK